MKALRTILLVVTAALLSSCAVSRYAANSAYPDVDAGYVPKGELQSIFYKSSGKGPSKRRMFVYLPEGYGSGKERYPVLYLLHGARENEVSWINSGNILKNLDSLSSNTGLKKCIVVLPNMNQYDDDNDYGKSRIKSTVEAFCEVDGTVETWFINDVVNLVDSLYRTIPSKEGRAIAGLSIGGMQSMYISANYPDKFAYVGLFSPMVSSLHKHSEYLSFYDDLEGKQLVQFSDPTILYWVMIGIEDIFYPQMNRFDEYLTKRGYRHRFYICPGGHEWYNWEDFSIIFLEQFLLPDSLL